MVRRISMRGTRFFKVARRMKIILGTVPSRDDAAIRADTLQRGDKAWMTRLRESRRVVAFDHRLSHWTSRKSAFFPSQPCAGRARYILVDVRLRPESNW